jgi:pimeloyl-ACP methyl ester carboxylesterase
MLRTLSPLLAALLVAGCGQHDPPASEPASAHVDTGYVDVGTTDLYYEDTGDGPALVLVHGGLLDHTMWDPHMDTLSSEFRVIRYDVRGHGKSEAVPDTFANYDDLRILIEYLGLNRPVLVGHSMGGRIVTDLALAYPEHLGALVLVGPGMSGFELDSPELEALEVQAMEAFGEGDLDLAVEFFQRAWTDGIGRTPDDVDPAVREKVRSLLRFNIERYDPASVVNPLDPPAVNRLDEIQVPTLAIVGTLDMPDIREIVGLVEEKIPGSKVVSIPGTAHMVNLENPDRFERELMMFMKGLETVSE